MEIYQWVMCYNMHGKEEKSYAKQQKQIHPGDQRTDRQICSGKCWYCVMVISMQNHKTKKAGKTTCIIIIFLVLFILSGCDRNNVVSHNNQENTEKNESVSISYTAEYVNNNGPFEINEWEKACLIDSYDEYLKLLLDPDVLSSSMNPGSTISIKDIIKRYNEQWFSDHQLIVVETMENSGSYRLKVLGINRIGNNVVINIERSIPEAFSDDCKAWQILIETDRCIDNNAEFEVVISNRRV